jgi:hypothetical protein
MIHHSSIINLAWLRYRVLVRTGQNPGQSHLQRELPQCEPPGRGNRFGRLPGGCGWAARCSRKMLLTRLSRTGIGYLQVYKTGSLAKNPLPAHLFALFKAESVLSLSSLLPPHLSFLGRTCRPSSV